MRKAKQHEMIKYRISQADYATFIRQVTGVDVPVAGAQSFKAYFGEVDGAYSLIAEWLVTVTGADRTRQSTISRQVAQMSASVPFSQFYEFANAEHNGELDAMSDYIDITKVNSEIYFGKVSGESYAMTITVDPFATPEDPAEDVI